MNDEIKNYIDNAIRMHLHDGNFSQRVNLFDLFGNIQTTDIVPTDVPKNIYGQFVIYKNGTTYRLYWYDFVNKVWKYNPTTFADTPGAPGIYTGWVNSNGTIGSYNPNGFSSARSSGFPAGRYDITHNLGTTNYSVITVAGGGSGSTNVFTVAQNISANTFSVGCFNVPGNAFADSGIMFVLTKI